MRRLAVFVLSIAVLFPMAVAFAQDDARPVVVADIRGPLDQRGIDFLIDAITTPDAQMVVLQLSSPGVASGDIESLFDAVRDAPVPVVAWVGPAGVDVHGGVAWLALLADHFGAAPGASFGYLEPVVQRGPNPTRPELPILASCPPSTCAPPEEIRRPLDPELFDGTITFPADRTQLTRPVPGGPLEVTYVDVITPSIGAYIVGLDGIELRGSIIETGETVVNDDGVEVVTPSVRVSFVKPTLLDRTLRLAIRPEATFFFLLVGIAAIAFEFYAAGAGLTAGVAVFTLLLAGYGLATLPMNWVSLAMVLVGMLLWTAAFQRNRLGPAAALGTLLLLVGGLRFTTASPQFRPSIVAVVATIIGIGLFYMFALTTVVRARFSTQTIGRESLVGKRGVAETSFDPEGIVNIDGARWRARSTRAAALGPGDPVEIYEVKGILLEVGPAE